MSYDTQSRGVKFTIWTVLYRVLTSALRPFLRRHLIRRISAGKEDPIRWSEKLAQTSAERPEGQLIWLHAVGLGETLALRGVIQEMQIRLPDARFLVTSSTRASAEVFLENAPPRTTHQFLPFDTPKYVEIFLDHWRPDLLVWTEQELWPGYLLEAAQRGIPQVLINARMTDKGFARRRRFGSLYKALYSHFELIFVQNQRTERHMRALGAKSVSVNGLLKANNPTLGCDQKELTELQTFLSERFVWIVASSHPEDEALALAAHCRLLEKDAEALLVLVPRFPSRAEEIIENNAELAPCIYSGQSNNSSVWIVDQFGTLGLWYRLANAAVIGGTNSEVNGHNPWEAVSLGCPVLHGPKFENFEADYPLLDEAGGALSINSAEQLSAALLDRGALTKMRSAANVCRKEQKQAVSQMFDTMAQILR